MYRTGIRPIVNGEELDVPIAAISAGQLLSYDGTSIVGVPVGPGGDVTGPGSSVVGNLATWNDTSGTALADSGLAVASVVRSAGSPVAGRIAQYSVSSPPTIINGLLAGSEVVGNTSGNIAVGNLISSNNIQGTRVVDSGVAAANVVQGATRVYTAAAQNMTGALADVSGMSCTLTAGVYAVRLTPIYIVTGAGIVGFAFSYSGTTLLYRMGGRYQITATGSQSNEVVTVVNTAYAAVNPVTGAALNLMFMAELDCIISVNNGGTLQLRTVISAGAGTVQQGTAFTVTRV